MWSFKGSKDLVNQCGDVCFWDVTYNSTRFALKLGTFTLVDSEFGSRAVFFSLCLNETARVTSDIISHWHEVFEKRLPRVVFTDGDSSTIAYLSALRFADEIHHLLCTWHLFDKNL